MPPSRRQLPIVADRWGRRGAFVCGSSVIQRIELMTPLRVTPPLVDPEKSHAGIPRSAQGRCEQG
eukprot:5043084-Pyramimonas_sp.AAC.1